MFNEDIYTTTSLLQSSRNRIGEDWPDSYNSCFDQLDWVVAFYNRVKLYE